MRPKIDFQCWRCESLSNNDEFSVVAGEIDFPGNLRLVAPIRKRPNGPDLCLLSRGRLYSKMKRVADTSYVGRGKLGTYLILVESGNAFELFLMPDHEEVVKYRFLRGDLNKELQAARKKAIRNQTL